MRIKYLIKTKGNPSNIYVRFFNSKVFDISVKSGFVVAPKLWSNVQQRVKNTSDNDFNQIINPQLTNLRDHILLNYNKDFTSGKKIDKSWLELTVASFHGRPSSEQADPKYFLAPYFKQYIKSSSNRINQTKGEHLSERTIAKYKGTLRLLEDFESHQKEHLRFQDLDVSFFRAFQSFMVDKMKYNSTTQGKHLEIIRSVCTEARLSDVKVNPFVHSNRFSVKKEETFDTYLNEQEIDAIFNLDLSGNEGLDNSRDWLVIGCWTGLRISDIQRLEPYMVQDDGLMVLDTKKTGSVQRIPLHRQVKSTLEKRGGSFPNHLSSQKFNQNIKEVVGLAGINQVIFGKKMMPVELPNGRIAHRKLIGYYPKNELVTSHTCRRSFATNHYGKLPNRTIMAFTGHTSEEQFESYLKHTQSDHIEAIKKLWENKSI